MQVIQERDSSNVTQRQNVWDDEGLLTQSVKDGASWRHYLAVNDLYGNVAQMVRADTRAVVARWDYDAYGKTTKSQAALSTADSLDRAQVNQPYRYQGHYLHAPSGLYDFGFRFYSPTLQRWMSSDPIEESGGINLHSYVGGNPTNAFDEYGEYIETAIDVVGAAYDCNEFWKKPTFWGGVSATASVASVFVPIPGPGAAKLAYKAAQIASKEKKAAASLKAAKAAQNAAKETAKKKAEGAARRATEEALQNIGKRITFGSRKAAEDAARAATNGRNPIHHAAKNGHPPHFHPRVPKGHPQEHDHYYY